jgi:hypothetical protein
MTLARREKQNTQNFRLRDKEGQRIKMLENLLVAGCTLK